jgi:GDP-L-fucose synthase
MSFWKGKKVLVTGGGGFIGSHIVDYLTRKRNVPPETITVPRSKDCDLRILENALGVMEGTDVVIHLAAKTGGILFNLKNPASQFYDVNLINAQVVEAARIAKIKRFLSISCVCAYPSNAPCPLKEDDIFMGRPEETHLGYGFAKRMMLPQAEAYYKQYGMNVSVVIPVNTYGPREKFDKKTAHVIPALIHNCLTEKELVLWGDGSPLREYLYVEDLAEAIVIATEKLEGYEPINIGSGVTVSIKRLVEIIVELTGFEGKISWDLSKPKGQLKRAMDTRRCAELLDWRPRYSLEEGLCKTIDWVRKELEVQSAQRNTSV